MKSWISCQGASGHLLIKLMTVILLKLGGFKNQALGMIAYKNTVLHCNMHAAMLEKIPKLC